MGRKRLRSRIGILVGTAASLLVMVGSQAHGQVLVASGLARREGPLSVGEDALAQTFAEATLDRLEAGHVQPLDSETDDHEEAGSADQREEVPRRPVQSHEQRSREQCPSHRYAVCRWHPWEHLRDRVIVETAADAHLHPELRGETSRVR